MGDQIQAMLSQAASATLVKYDNPVMVTTHSKSEPKFVINVSQPSYTYLYFVHIN